jgi:hypothetical protein
VSSWTIEALFGFHAPGNHGGLERVLPRLTVTGARHTPSVDRSVCDVLTTAPRALTEQTPGGNKMWRQ